MSKFSMEESVILDGIASKIMAEEPKLNAVLKNLCTVIISKYFLPEPVQNSLKTFNPENVDDSQDSCKLSSEKKDPSQIQPQPQLLVSHGELSPEVVLAVVRLIVRSIEETTLLEPLAWGSVHPQQTSQMADSRLDELLLYKVIQQLHEKVKVKGGKVCQLFGKSFLTGTKIWPTIRNACIEKNKSLAVEKKIDDNVLQYVLQIFQDSFTDNISSATSSASVSTIPAIHSQSLQRLVWTSNFTEELTKLRKEREEMKANVNYNNLLAAVTGEEERAGDSADNAA